MHQSRNAKTSSVRAKSLASAVFASAPNPPASSAPIPVFRLQTLLRHRHRKWMFPPFPVFQLSQQTPRCISPNGSPSPPRNCPPQPKTSLLLQPSLAHDGNGHAAGIEVVSWHFQLLHPSKHTFPVPVAGLLFGQFRENIGHSGPFVFGTVLPGKKCTFASQKPVVVAEAGI